MNNKAIIILIVVIAGFLGTIFLMGGFPFGNESDEPIINEYSIKSNDELAELIIPKDSLPDNVDPDNISVTRIPNNQFEDESWIVYRLEPEGLEFEDEILFQVQLDAGNNTVPIVFISTSTGIDLANNTKSEVDLETKKQIVSIPLTHFSEIFLEIDLDAFSIEASARHTPVGGQIPTTVSFTLNKDTIYLDRAYTRKGFIIWEFIEPRLSIKGYWVNYDDEGLSPIGESGAKPDLMNVFVNQTVTFQDDTFKCITKGMGYGLVYNIMMYTDMIKKVYMSEEDYLAGNGTISKTRNYHHSAFAVALFDCLPEVIGDDPKIDPRVEPKVEVSSKVIMNNEGLLVRKEIFVDIEAYPGSTGTVTLSGPDMQPMIQQVSIDGSAQKRLTFIVYAYGQYTVLVEIGEFSIEKIFWA